MTVGRIPVIEGGIQPTIFDAKADLLTATAADTAARLAVGTDYGFLQADSTQSTGLLWNNAAWTNYTPTVTAQTGTITTLSANTGYYLRIGKLCAFYVKVQISNKGTGAGYLGITLPFTTANTTEQVFVGRESIATGTTLNGLIGANENKMQVLTYNALTIIENNYRINMSGIFEVA
jgi:hypothetical protein